MDLIQQLVSSLGVKEDQAKGGAGLLLGLAKDKLGGDFSKIAGVIPNANELIGKAPKSGGLLAAAGKLASSLGGKAGGLGSLAGLAGGFSKLGLDSGMIGKFVPVLLSFVQQKGGSEMQALLHKALGK